MIERLNDDPIVLGVPRDLPRWAAREVISYVDEIVMLSQKQDGAEAFGGVRSRSMHSLRAPDTIVGALFISALVDMATQGWSLSLVHEQVILNKPPRDLHDANSEKRRIRAGHLVERDRQLGAPSMRSFVSDMEATRLHRGRWVSIFSLMRDGKELAAQLADVEGDDDAAANLIDPYLQFVDSDGECEFTGLRLTDIWRYFRATWSNAYQSVPGRRMHVLVRDRAADCHPIIGLAALSSPVVQLKVRDDWIGWTPERILATLDLKVTKPDAQYFDSQLRQAIDDVYRADFLEDSLLSENDVRRPTDKVVIRLRREAKRTRHAHRSYPKATDYKGSGIHPTKIDWQQQARSFLFRSKRASTLATLLNARHILQGVGMGGPTTKGLRAALATKAGRKALAAILRSTKARHVGIDMLDITTCGAVQPYAHLLGGKLVSLLMLSPEVAGEYKARYAHAVSLIASGMKGTLVVRTPRLVFLGTTSLYGVSSSQYNRLKIPASEMSGYLSDDLAFICLGRTEGFGSYHFSQQTIELGERVASQARAGRRINSIFGEGVSPRLRKLRDALDAAGFPTDRVLKHGSPRLVYGAPIAANFREVLLGKSKRPRYLLPTKRAKESTQLICQFWRRRWLLNRIRRNDVLQAVEKHSLIRPIRHGARVRVLEANQELPLFQTDV